MLSEEERKRIAAEETYRFEIRNKLGGEKIKSAYRTSNVREQLSNLRFTLSVLIFLGLLCASVVYRLNNGLEPARITPAGYTSKPGPLANGGLVIGGRVYAAECAVAIHPEKYQFVNEEGKPYIPKGAKPITCHLVGVEPDTSAKILDSDLLVVGHTKVEGGLIVYKLQDKEGRVSYAVSQLVEKLIVKRVA